MMYQSLRPEVHFPQSHLHLTDHLLMHLLYLFQNSPDQHSLRIPVPSAHLSAYPMLLWLPYSHHLLCLFFPEHRFYRSVRQPHQLPSDHRKKRLHLRKRHAGEQVTAEIAHIQASICSLTLVTISFTRLTTVSFLPVMPLVSSFMKSGI